MGFAFNPFTGTFDVKGAGGGGASYIDGEVQNFSALPQTIGTPPVDSAYLVREAEGTWLLGRKPAGIYIRTANTGTRANDWTYAGAFPDVFNDANFLLYDNGDSTKNLQFQLSGIDTATTRTLTAPNASGTIALTQQANDIEITDSTKGVILKSPNNTRWRLTINDNGTLQRVALPLIAFLCMTASALSQNVTDVVADTNGVLVAPTNFFTANLQQWVTGSYVYAPTNNFSVTNSTTLTNIPSGSFTVSANTSYIYIASAYLSGSNGYHLAIDLPSIANAVVTNTASSGLYVGTGFSAPLIALFNSTNNMRILFRAAAQTTNNPSFAIGTFRVGATGGTANLQFAQGGSSGNPSEITAQTRILIFPLP